jgi:TonB family protein
VVSFSAVAQTAPRLKTITPGTVTVSPNVLRGMAEAEPDIVAPAGTRDGSVYLQVAVSTTGAVQEVVAVTGPEDLRRAATDGVMGWSYKPYLLNGQPQEVQSIILLDFHDGVGKRAVDAAIPGMAGIMGGRSSLGSRPDSEPDTRYGAVRISGGVAASMLEQAPQPLYPPIAKAAHVQGTVVLHALISKTGDVDDLQVISGPPMLVAAAEDAVRKWKYRPYLLNGLPVAVETTINVNFRFAEPPKPPATGDAGGR